MSRFKKLGQFPFLCPKHQPYSDTIKRRISQQPEIKNRSEKDMMNFSWMHFYPKSYNTYEDGVLYDISVKSDIYKLFRIYVNIVVVLGKFKFVGNHNVEVLDTSICPKPQRCGFGQVFI